MIRLVPKFRQHLYTIVGSMNQGFSTLRRVGKLAVSDLPAYKMNTDALRPAVKDEPQASLNEYSDLVGNNTVICRDL